MLRSFIPFGFYSLKLAEALPYYLRACSRAYLPRHTLPQSQGRGRKLRGLRNAFHSISPFATALLVTDNAFTPPQRFGVSSASQLDDSKKRTTRTRLPIPVLYVLLVRSNATNKNHHAPIAQSPHFLALRRRMVASPHAQQPYQMPLSLDGSMLPAHVKDWIDERKFCSVLGKRWIIKKMPWKTTRGALTERPTVLQKTRRRRALCLRTVT